jgi:hypothetical protein
MTGYQPRKPSAEKGRERINRLSDFNSAENARKEKCSVSQKNERKKTMSELKVRDYIDIAEDLLLECDQVSAKERKLIIGEAATWVNLAAVVTSIEMVAEAKRLNG